MTPSCPLPPSTSLPSFVPGHRLSRGYQSHQSANFLGGDFTEVFVDWAKSLGGGAFEKEGGCIKAHAEQPPATSDCFSPSA